MENDETRPDKISSAEGYQDGCEALADGVSADDKSKLRKCVTSVLNYIKEGSKNRCDMVEKMFSLKHDEQNFIGPFSQQKVKRPLKTKRVTLFRRDHLIN